MWRDTRPFPVQGESEQQWTRQESTESERSESDLFSGSAKREKSDFTTRHILGVKKTLKPQHKNTPLQARFLPDLKKSILLKILLVCKNI